MSGTSNPQSKPLVLETKNELLQKPGQNPVLPTPAPGRVHLYNPSDGGLLPTVAARNLRSKILPFCRTFGNRLLLRLRMRHSHHQRKPRSSPFFFALRMRSPRSLGGAPTHRQYSVITCECNAMTYEPARATGKCEGAPMRTAEGRQRC